MRRKPALFLIFIITLIAFCLTLVGCAPFKPNSTKAGMCNELNSRLIFNGSTSNIQQAEVDEAQAGLEQQTYDRKCE